MSMIVVLIVMTWMGNQAVGPVVSMQEFSSSERCEAAIKALNEQAAFWAVRKDNLQAFCVPK
jgi:hypothetical protein